MGNTICINYISSTRNNMKESTNLSHIFSNCTQRVQIDNDLSDFANIICGGPQGKILGPLKLCLYLLPLSAILRYHNIGYHVYADDTAVLLILGGG